MSAIANLSSVAAALLPVNSHPHGHKRGPHVQSTIDSGSGSAAHMPAESKQNLFGSLLNSLEQVLGVQATTPAAAAAGSTDPSAAGAPVSTANPVATANPVSAAAQSSLTALQNYLNNLLHHQRADGSAANLAGENLNVIA